MKNIYNLITSVSLYFIVHTLPAQTFIPKTDFPDSNRSDMGFFTIGSNIYSLGGIDSLFNFYKDLWQYNTLTDSWTKKGDFISPALYPKAGIIGNKAYLGNYWNGGETKGDWWEYDSTNDTWTPKTPLPGPARFGASTFAWGGEVYAIGGESYDTTTQTYGIYNNVFKYTPSTDSWIELDTFIGGGRTGAYTIVDDNTVYLGMGQNDGGGIWYGDLFKYDLVNNVWTTLTPLPFSPSGPAGDASFSGIYNEKIVLFSTDWNIEEPTDFNNIYVYDIISDTWTIYNNALPAPWRIFGWHGQVGSKGYFGQGRDYLTSTFYTDIYEVNMEKVITSVMNENPGISNIKVSATTRNIFISFPDNIKGKFSLNLQTIDGKQLKSIILGSENNIDISELNNGIYIWTISVNEKTVKSGRIIRM